MSNLKIKLFMIASKNNTILRNKVNKGNVGLLHYKQQNIFERS